jgi:hypothetical protein
MVDALRKELEQLRSSYMTARPPARLASIRQRLARTEGDGGPTRLVTLVSAVEALARSLVVHAPGRPASSSHFRHEQVRTKDPAELVEEALRLHEAKSARDRFGDETWQLFELAAQYRDLVVHECTHPGPDPYPALLAASQHVLDGLVEAGGLPRLVSHGGQRLS